MFTGTPGVSPADSEGHIVGLRCNHSCVNTLLEAGEMPAVPADRVPVGSPDKVKVLLSPNGLDVHKFTNSEFAELAPVAGMFDTTERQARI